MGATFNTGYLENLILYNGSNNIGIGTSADATYKVTLGGSLLGTSATFSSSVTAGSVLVDTLSLGTDGTYGGTYKTLGFTGNTNGSHRIFAGTSDDLYIAAATSRGITFWTNGSSANRMTITSGGNVGIGVTPDGGNGIFDTVGFAGTITASVKRVASFYSTTAENADRPGIVLGYDTNGAGVIAARTQSAGQPLAFWTYNGSSWGERMRITSGGNVGIGTSSISTTSTPHLFIKDNNISMFGGGSRDSYVGTNFYYNSAWYYRGTGGASMTQYDDDVIIFKNAASGSANGALTWSERMRITNVGTVIVKGQNDDIVQVGDSISGHNAYLQLKAGSTGNAYVNSTGSGSLILGANGAASNHLQITSGGNVLIGSTGIYGGGTTNESELLVVGNPPTADTDRGLISFMDNRAYNTATLGAKVMMGGAYNTAGAITFFAGLAGLKENTTDGNYAGALAFYTRANGAASSERMRITSGGVIQATTDTLQWYDKKVKFYATYTSINGGASQNFDFSVGSNSQISILVRAGGRSNNPAGGMYHLFGYMFPSGFLSSYTIHANQISFSYSWVNSSTIRITVTNSQPSDAVNLNLQFEINSQFQQ
jgi:hypothetical protein